MPTPQENPQQIVTFKMQLNKNNIKPIKPIKPIITKPIIPNPLISVSTPISFFHF